MICSNEVMRSSLVDNGGIYNQILVNFRNPVIHTINHLVRHLKLYIDDYDQQWVHMSPLIVNTISELTLLIIDNQFKYYNGQIFISLLQNISNDCHLHFYLQFIPNLTIPGRDMDTLVQSFQNHFYIQHQSNASISYARNFRRVYDCPLLIYTSPFCASKLTVFDNQEIVGVSVSILLQKNLFETYRIYVLLLKSDVNISFIFLMKQIILHRKNQKSRQPKR